MDVDKVKGLVFGFNGEDSNKLEKVQTGQKLLESAINSGRVMSRGPMVSETQSDRLVESYEDNLSSFVIGSTVYVSGSLKASSSGTNQKKSKPRKRPYKSKRKLKGAEGELHIGEVKLKEGVVKVNS